MENAPISPDDHENLDDDDEQDSSKSKKAEKLGLFLVKPEKPKADKEPKKELPPLKLFELEPDEKAEKQEQLDDPAEITPEEKQHIEQELVAEYDNQQLDIDFENSPDEVAAEEAVEDFHEKIEDGMDSEDAFQETMRQIEDGSEDDKDEDEDAGSNSTSSTSSSSSTSTTTSTSSTGGGSSTSTGSTTGTGGSSGSGGGGTGGHGGGHAPIPPVPPNVPRTPNRPPISPNQYRKKHNVGDALAGAIVGYLVGRRKNKVKSEKQLIPIQKKLEKKVEDLRFSLEQKEAKIRDVARAKSFEKRIKQEAKHESFTQTSIKEPEKFGKVAMGAESVVYRREVTQTPPEKLTVDKHVERLKRFELLEISKKIVVEGRSLKQMYESNLFGEKALRRLVKEYLKGGDLQRALRRELNQQDVNFELDPEVRRESKEFLEDASKQRGPVNQLQSMIDKATEALPFGADSNLSYSQRDPGQASKVSNSRSKNKTVDLTLMGIIILLFLVVIFLLFRNGNI